MFVGVGFGDEEIREATVRIETDHAVGVGDEIREGINVVVEEAAGRIVSDVFDATDFDSGEMHDAFDGTDDFARGFVGFDGEAVLRGVDGAAGAALKLFARGALANVARAEIVGFPGSADFDGVKIFSAEDFNARDDAVAWRETFLNEGSLIHAEAEAIFVDGLFELSRRIETLDACAAAANVGFYD